MKEDSTPIQFTGTVGILTPYRDQVHELRRVYNGHFPRGGDPLESMLRLGTVDGFQGQEMDIVISTWHCVRCTR